MRFYDTGLNVKYLQDFRGSYKPKTTYCCFNHDPSEFSLVCDFALYIVSLLDVVSIFRVQFRGPIRSCNKNITMTTHSLNVGCELCGSRRLCVIGNYAGKSICERYLFLSKRKSCRALNSTKSEKLIPKIATLRQGGLTSMHLCCLWGAQNRSVKSATRRLPLSKVVT